MIPRLTHRQRPATFFNEMLPAVAHSARSLRIFTFPYRFFTAFPPKQCSHEKLGFPERGNRGNEFACSSNEIWGLFLAGGFG